MKKATVRTVDTPHGEGRLHTRRASRPMATLLLSHGAGGGVDARDLWSLADALPAQGFSVVLFEQPWRVAGRKVATAPPTIFRRSKSACQPIRWWWRATALAAMAAPGAWASMAAATMA